MSEVLGPLSFGQKEEQIFLGKEFARHRDYSEEVAINIDKEIMKLVTDNFELAKKTMLEHRDVVERIAQALLERETLDAKEIEALIEGHELPPLEESVSEHPETSGPVELTPIDEGNTPIVGGASPRGAPDPKNI